MQLAHAFKLCDKEVVAFVGGGGKTTAMFRLADELVAHGKRVVTTTTTRIFAAQIQLAPRHIFASDLAQTIRDTRSALRDTPHVLIIGATNQAGKAFGVEPAWIDELIAQDEIDAVLIEADGSRMRPFKAPAEHEPVIPQTTTLLVPVVSISVLNKPLNDEHVHRAELVARLAEISEDTLLQPEHIARVIAHPRGGLKNRPPHARVIPLINKVETELQKASAREIAQRLITHDEIYAVAIGAVKNAAPSFGAPVSNLESRIAAVILAAGGSTRMRGETKQLLPWGNGTLIQNAAAVTSRAQFSEIVVVTGNEQERVERALEEIRGMDKPMRIVFNPAWASGRASSVRAGIGALRENSTAAIFINADQPFVTAPILNQIITRYSETLAPIVAPTFDGQFGSPVLIARELFAELAALRGDVGGKALFQKYRAQLECIAIDDTRAAMDLDTPEEYASARKLSAP